MNYEEFLDGSFPDPIVTEHVQNISKQRIAAELILIGIVEKQLVIAHVADGDVMITDTFAAIGSGYAIAESTLFQRQQQGNSSLEDDDLLCL